jgi:hypothetical protein
MDDRDDRKIVFARALARDPTNVWAAASAVTSDDGERYRICQEWPGDPVVLAETRRIRGLSEDDALAGLASKAEFVNDLWDRMNNAVDVEDYSKLAKLYADVRGYIQKPGEAAAKVSVTNNVMVVPVLPSSDAWETEARKQQAALIVAGESVKELN